jgi:hypothetical protein
VIPRDQSAFSSGNHLSLLDEFHRCDVLEPARYGYSGPAGAERLMSFVLSLLKSTLKERVLDQPRTRLRWWHCLLRRSSSARIAATSSAILPATFSKVLRGQHRVHVLLLLLVVGRLQVVVVHACVCELSYQCVCVEASKIRSRGLPGYL